MLDVSHAASPDSQIKNPERSILPDEPLPLAFRRINLGLFGKAIAGLRNPGSGDFDASIHSTRKTLKRIRGHIRLVRDEVGYRSYREENVVLRDTSRSVSGIRDSWVLIQTLDGLRARYQDLLDGTTFDHPEAWLKSRHEARRSQVTRTVVMNAIVNLGAARSRFARFPMEGVVRDDFSALAPGVGRVYQRGLKGYQLALETGDTEDLHEWRKRVKYLRYQMESLRPMHPALLGTMAKELHVLTELLGDDHDLAVLAETILDNPDSCSDSRERWMLLALIHQGRANLQAQAFRSGGALYTESPDAFVDRIAAYWESGRR